MSVRGLSASVVPAVSVLTARLAVAGTSAAGSPRQSAQDSGLNGPGVKSHGLGAGRKMSFSKPQDDGPENVNYPWIFNSQ
jgi:hypothetical protein